MNTNVPLGEVCHVVMGQAPSGTSYNQVGEGLPLVAGAGDFGDVYPKPKKFTKEPTNTAKSGDIIMCIRATIGDLNLADREVCLGRGVAGIRPKNCKLNPRYLWHWLAFNNPNLEKLGKGSTFKQVTRADIEGQFFSVLPEPIQQERIAAILDKADAIRRKRRQALPEIDALLRSQFDEMFGEYASKKHGWASEPLANIVERVTVGHVGPSSHGIRDTGVPFLRTQNIGDGDVLADDLKFISSDFARSLQKSALKEGDVIISRHISDQIRSAIVPAELSGANCANIVIVRPGELLTPSYIHLLLRTPLAQSKLLERQVGSAQRVVNTRAFQSWHVPRPDRGSLAALESIFQRAKKLKAQLASAFAEADQLFLCLSQRAFRGEL
jgi:type I restriction enzyme, S subunit